MNNPILRRSLGAVLALMIVLCALPVTALAAPAENTAITLKPGHVTLDETTFEYTGQEIRPNVTVRADGLLLTLDQDYTLTYVDNVHAGTAKAVVTGIGFFTGTVEVPFYIQEKTPEFTLVELNSSNVTINGKEFAYTGAPIEPAITVTAEGRTLTRDQDYSLEYVNNMLPGTGTAIVRGIVTASETLGYSGEVRVHFIITPAQTEEDVEITALNVTLSGTEFPYTGQEIRPAVTVKVEGNTLTEGTDYRLAYKNNIQPGKATVIVTAQEGSGYTGIVRAEYTILPKTPEVQPPVILKAENAALEGQVFTHTGKAIEPKVTVTVGGTVLVRDKDYTLSYENNVSVGTGKAIVTGIGGYTGTVDLTFTIEAAAEDAPQPVKLLDKHVKLSGARFNYTGKAVQPRAIVTVDGQVLKLDKDYTVTYKNNVKVGKATAVVTGIGSYTGTVEVDFTITAGQADDSNPKTADTFPLHAMYAVLFVSATGLIGCGFAWKKKLF